MSKARVIVLSVVRQGLTKAKAAKFDVSRQWVHTLVTRYETGGLDASNRSAAIPVLILILVDHTSVTVTHLNAGEILGEYLIEPDKNYWRNQTKEPGRWPGSS